MLRYSFVVLLMVLSTLYVEAQKKLTWNDFADVTFVTEYNEKYGVDFYMPTFGSRIKAFNGKQVSIKGYFLDISASGEVFLLSMKPMAACFFCGGAGPETIIEVVFKEKPPFVTDQIIEVTGILQLNRDDVDHCNYILKEATGYLAL